MKAAKKQGPSFLNITQAYVPKLNRFRNGIATFQPEHASSNRGRNRSHRAGRFRLVLEIMGWQHPEVAAYAVSIFTGAFLLFQVQPLIGKYLLPWFGGATGVWTTCMLFFQLLLLGGYAYAHLSSRLLKPRNQAILHLALVVAALATLPITPSEPAKWPTLHGKQTC